VTAFATTFLSHQGWMVRSGRSCVLVDPLICEEFGKAHALDYRVQPPADSPDRGVSPDRRSDPESQHDDHFDIPSLARLDRQIPDFMSAYSSIAAFQILREMGFAVHPLVPGAPIEFGDLQVIPFSGDHVSVNCADEWDALPFLIRDMGGAGSLFSMVDVMLLPVHVEWAKAYVPRPGLVTWSNNALDWSHIARPAPGRPWAIPSPNFEKL
jgi:L-ascorbate metabolism protein UlaG (beta-lactamase superfamily)